jgi:hypothetical protein
MMAHINAAKDADILFVEGITGKNIKYAPWGGDTEDEKVKTQRKPAVKSRSRIVSIIRSS